MTRDRIDKGLLQHYRDITRRALDSVTPLPEKGTKEGRMAQRFLKMARSYFSDSEYFEEKEDMVNALCAIYYAHAWLDAGVAAGFLHAEDDGDLFVMPE